MILFDIIDFIIFYFLYDYDKLFLFFLFIHIKLILFIYDNYLLLILLFIKYELIVDTIPLNPFHNIIQI